MFWLSIKIAYIMLSIIASLFMFFAMNTFWVNEYPTIDEYAMDKTSTIIQVIFASLFWPVFVPVTIMGFTKGLKHGISFSWKGKSLKRIKQEIEVQYTKDFTA